MAATPEAAPKSPEPIQPVSQALVIHHSDLQTLKPRQKELIGPLVQSGRIKITGSDQLQTDPRAINLLDLAVSLTTTNAGDAKTRAMASIDLVNMVTLAGIMEQIKQNQGLQGLYEYYVNQTQDPIQALAMLTGNIQIREGLEKSAGSLALAQAAANTAKELLPREDELKQMPRMAGLMSLAQSAQSRLNVQDIRNTAWEGTMSDAADTAGKTSGKIAGGMLMAIEPAMAVAATAGDISQRHPMGFVGLLIGAGLGVTTYAHGVDLSDLYKEGFNLKDTVEALGTIPVVLLTGLIGAVAAESLPRAASEGAIRLILYIKESISRIRN